MYIVGRYILKTKLYENMSCCSENSNKARNDNIGRRVNVYIITLCINFSLFYYKYFSKSYI